MHRNHLNDQIVQNPVSDQKYLKNSKNDQKYPENSKRQKYPKTYKRIKIITPQSQNYQNAKK